VHRDGVVVYFSRYLGGNRHAFHSSAQGVGDAHLTEESEEEAPHTPPAPPRNPLNAGATFPAEESFLDGFTACVHLSQPLPFKGFGKFPNLRMVVLKMIKEEQRITKKKERSTKMRSFMQN
jgi:hypothetical protein